MNTLRIEEESARCLLCDDAPCSKGCTNGHPARMLRAVRFGNAAVARQWVDECSESDLLAAEQACIHYDRPIRISDVAKQLPEQLPAQELPALEIDFCGIRCENPFFLASSAICTNYDMVARAFEAGWAGVFYKTICFDDINEVSPRFDVMHIHGAHGDFAALRNMEQLSENPTEVDFDILRRLKQDYPTKVVVASIMGSTEEQWVELAKMAQAVGADAVELNFSCPQMRIAGMGSDVGQNSELVFFYTAHVKDAVSIPVIPKMTPNITRINDPAMAAFYARADAISAINTIKSITMSVDSSVSGKNTVSGLSGRAVKPIALRYIFEIASNAFIDKEMPLSGIGGIETWRDALDFILLGCRNVQVCTAVMQYGYRIIDDLKLGLQHYMAERGISAVEQLVGQALPSFVKPSDLDRTTVVYPMIDHRQCIGCGRCYISCMDGGHQAITFDDRRPKIVGSKCVGCHLCRLVCPTGAIAAAKRVKKRGTSATSSGTCG